MCIRVMVILTYNSHVCKLHECIVSRCDCDFAEIRSRLLDSNVFEKDSALSRGSHLKIKMKHDRTLAFFGK